MAALLLQWILYTCSNGLEYLLVTTGSVCGAQDQLSKVMWSSCKSRAVFPMCVSDQRFQGVTEEPATIHDCIVSHRDTPCLQGELGPVLCSLCCCHHPALHSLLFLVRKGISVPRASSVFEAGDALTSLDCFLELAGAHLHQHHPPSFCAASAGFAVSIFLLCCIILTSVPCWVTPPTSCFPSSNLVEPLTHLLQHGVCSAPLGFFTGAFHHSFSPSFHHYFLWATSLNIYFPLSGCLSLHCSLFRDLLSEMFIEDLTN